MTPAQDLSKHIVERAWGYYTILTQGDGYLVKKLVFKPNCSISMQYHELRAEKWFFVSGYGEMYTKFVVDPHDNTGMTVKRLPLDTMFIPQKCWHKFTAGPEGCEVIEIWYGNSSEDDIIRE